MATTITSPPVAARAEDQRVTLHDVSWADFEIILHIRGDPAGVRLTYLNGMLELMSPSVDHEGVKKTIPRLLEAYAEERALPLNGFGSWTLKNPARARALEPDECYALSLGRPARPDLAIEVIWTPGGIDKLEVHRGLGIREVWFWREGVIEVHVSRGRASRARERSDLLPELDLVELARHVDAEDQTGSVRRYRQTLQRAHG
jgi:Uma2 family endonuclease